MAERGVVIKGIGGFYFIDTGKEVFRAKGRGILKRNKSLIIIGDEVMATKPAPGDDGVIIELFPRKNYFSRPPVSNIDKMVVVFSVTDPEPNLEVVDRLLVMAENKAIEPIVCINKSDLDRDDLVDKLVSTYKPIYPTVVTSCIEKSVFSDNGNDLYDKSDVSAPDETITSGVDALIGLIDGFKVAFAGPSGVGKSSLTNALIPEAKMETGSISRKTSRGKHTTRHVEMIPFRNGYIYDTPGFTSFDLEGVEEEQLQKCFPEIEEASEKCRFRNCVHIKEPECNVISEVDSGNISLSRYNSYLSCLKEIRERNEY